MVTALVVSGVLGLSAGAGASTAPVISRQVTIDPGAGGSLSLADVSCTSATTCTAVGSLVSGSTNTVEPVALAETSGTWGAPVAITLPSGAFEDGSLNGLIAVQCVSAGNCEAVGRFANGASETTTPMASAEVNGVWAAATPLGQPANGSSGISAWLTGLSCPSAGNCSAVGTYFNQANQAEPMVVTETNGSWGSPSEIVVATGDQPVQGEWSVSCTSASCTAAGPLMSGSSDVAGVASETNGSWSDASPVSSTLGTSINDISCQNAGCVAVGAESSSSGSTPALFSEANGTWTLKSLNSSPAGGDALLVAVSCVSWGNCDVAGDVTTGTGVFAVAEEKGVWTKSLSIPVSSGASATVVAITGLSCAAALSCVAVGGVGTSTDVNAVAWTSHAAAVRRTIVCRRGHLLRRVSGVAPRCPTGFRRT